MTLLKKVRRALPYAAAILGIVVLYRFTRPVLFYIPADCVCTDYSDRVQSFAVLNPLRNRAPEQAADRFFQDVRNRRTSAVAEPELAARMAKGSVGVSSWQLAFREDQRNSVRLYYKLDVDGEGMVEMKRNSGSWRAANFDATF